MSSIRRNLLLGCGLLLAALLVVIGAVHLRPKWAVARYQRQLLAAGEKLDVEQLLPPALLPEGNGALVFSRTMGAWRKGNNVLETNPPFAMHMVAPGKAMIAWAQPDVRSVYTNTWSDVEAAMARDADTLELVRSAASLPAFDFQLNYREGPSLLLPHLAPLKLAVQRLTIAALCDLHRGDAAAAVTNLQTMLALVKATADEPLAISQLVRLAMAHISLAATWELLQSPNLTDQQLAAIQRDWTDLNFIQPAQDSLAMERNLGQMMLERMRNSSALFRQVFSSGGGGPVSSSSSFAQNTDTFLRDAAVGIKQVGWRLFLSYPDQLRALKGFQALLDSFRMVRAGQSFNAASAYRDARLAELGPWPGNQRDQLLGTSGPNLRSFFSESVASLTRVLNRVFTAEVARQMVVTALALKRYHLTHGQFPPELSALVPEFLVAVPRDPADGQSLRYHPQPDGTFLLYSVGEDGIDDHGDPSPPEKSESFGWLKGRDLVWPRPATPEEVSAYQQKEAKKHGR